MKKINPIENPVILHGPGRSGTTLTYKILARHKEFFWISNYVNNFNNPYLGLLNNLRRNETFDRLTRDRRKFPEPSEAYGFWKGRFKNYYELNDSPLPGESAEVIKALQTLNSLTLGSRFITKFTGRPRDLIFDEIFQSPTILWIERDPVSVIASYYKNKWFYKKKPNLWGEIEHKTLLKEYVDYYIRIVNSREALFKYKFLTVNYEDLINNRTDYFDKILDYIGLESTKEFQRVIQEWNIYSSANNGYRTYFSVEDVTYIRQRVQHECF